jgi:hypothetical protein
MVDVSEVMLMQVTSGFYFFGIFWSNCNFIFLNGKNVVFFEFFVTKFWGKKKLIKKSRDSILSPEGSHKYRRIIIFLSFIFLLPNPGKSFYGSILVQ